MPENGCSVVVDEEALRREMVATSRKVHTRGWVANHDGNISARLNGGRLLATPTAVSKGDVVPEWLIVVDSSGTVVEGTRRAFSELALHRAAYQARPDIGVVIHAHPPTATGFAVAGIELGHPFMAEPVVSLGPAIPTVPYFAPGAVGLDEAIGRALQGADVILLAQHGVLAVGGNLEQAFLRLELVEHLAQIGLVARQLGGVTPLPQGDVAQLIKKGRPVSLPNFAPDSGTANGSHQGKREGSTAGTDGRPDLNGLVTDALNRLR